MKSRLHSYAIQSHQGPYLNLNEDGHEIDLNNELFLLLDGFGGSGIGDQAVQKIRQDLKTFFLKVGGDREATLPFFYSPKYLLEGNALINAFHFAHKNMMAHNKERSFDRRGGASVVGCALSEHMATIVSTGNCLAYLYRRGGLTKLVIEDTLGPAHTDLYTGHFQMAPMNAIGLFEDLYLQIKEVRFEVGDQLLLLTDGCYARLAPNELLHFLDRYENLDDCINQIFTLVNGRGNMDNQSALILKF